MHHMQACVKDLGKPLGHYGLFTLGIQEDETFRGRGAAVFEDGSSQAIPSQYNNVIPQNEINSVHNDIKVKDIFHDDNK